MMFSPEKMHKQRLKEKNVVIETVYQHDNQRFIRTSDGSRNDSVYHAIKVQKNFYCNGKKLYSEKHFNKKEIYSILAKKVDTELSCTECGYQGPSSQFEDGCPYCGANFEVRQSGRKRDISYEVKEIFSMKKFKMFLFTISFITTVAICLPMIMNLNIMSLIFFLLNAFLFYYLFFILYSFLFLIVLIPYVLIKFVSHKDLPNDKIMVNGYRMSNEKLMNDIQMELMNYYYNGDLFPKYQNLIDFDILDYISYQVTRKNGLAAIRVKVQLRKYYLINGKVKKEIENDTILMIKNANYEPRYTSSIVKKCENCGANVGLFDKFCEYCKSVLPSNTLWVLDISNQIHK